MEGLDVALIHDNKSVVNVTLPEDHIVRKCGNSLLLNVFHHDVGDHRRKTGAHRYSGNLFEDFTLALEVSRFQTEIHRSHYVVLGKLQ